MPQATVPVGKLSAVARLPVSGSNLTIDDGSVDSVTATMVPASSTAAPLMPRWLSIVTSFVTGSITYNPPGPATTISPGFSDPPTASWTKLAVPKTRDKTSPKTVLFIVRLLSITAYQRGGRMGKGTARS